MLRLKSKGRHESRPYRQQARICFMRTTPCAVTGGTRSPVNTALICGGCVETDLRGLVDGRSPIRQLGCVNRLAGHDSEKPAGVTGRQNKCPTGAGGANRGCHKNRQPRHSRTGLRLPGQARGWGDGMTGTRNLDPPPAPLKIKEW
jgi:hypothetical protein